MDHERMARMYEWRARFWMALAALLLAVLGASVVWMRTAGQATLHQELEP